MIVIQAINTTWTWKATGAPLAAKRSATPLACPLPDVANDGSSRASLHTVECDEGRDFVPRDSWKWVDAFPVLAGGLRVLERKGGVAIERSPVRGSERPLRTAAQLLALDEGQWGRVIQNYSVPMEAVRLYAQVVLNVAVGLPYDRELFVEGEPSRFVDDRADLW
jgi:hypothetical protein